MSNLFDEAMSDADIYAEARASVEHLRELCPTLADLLGGTKGKSGVVDRSPGSVRLFSNGGRLKLEITGIDWVRKGYLLVPSEFKHFSHIESMLVNEKISWTKKAAQKVSMTEPPY